MAHADLLASTVGQRCSARPTTACRQDANPTGVVGQRRCPSSVSNLMIGATAEHLLLEDACRHAVEHRGGER